MGSLRYLSEDDMPPGLRLRLKGREKPPDAVQAATEPAKATRTKAKPVRSVLDAVTKEADVVTLIRHYLSIHGWQVIKHHPIKPAGAPVKMNGRIYVPIAALPEDEKAVPDLMLLHPRVPGARLLEAKRPGEKPSADQQKFIDANPLTAFWVDSYEILVSELTRLGLPGGRE